MPTCCAVASCNNTGHKGSSLSFFTFPKNPKLRKSWIVKCSRKDKFNPDTSYVCSDHFNETDFENFLKVKLVGGKLLLKKTAVPTVNLHSYSTKIKPETSRSKRYRKIEQREILKNIINLPSTSTQVLPDSLNETTETVTAQTDTDGNIPTLIQTTNTDLLEHYKKQLAEVTKENEVLRNKVIKLTEANDKKDNDLKALNRKIKALRSRAAVYNKKEAEKGRIYIRINYTNLKNKEVKHNVKRTATSDQARKNVKKMKKIMS